MQRIIIGLTGPGSGGKGEIAKYLVEKGFSYFSLSDRIREQADIYRWPHARKILQDLGDKLREDFGPDILAIRTIQMNAFKHADLVVVDSIRHPAEIDYFKDVFDAKIIGVTATPQKLFERMKLRGREGDPTTFPEFLELLERERGRGGSHTMQVDKCLQMADLVIQNDRGIPELVKETEVAITKLGIVLPSVSDEHKEHIHHEHHGHAGHEHHH